MIEFMRQYGGAKGHLSLGWMSGGGKPFVSHMGDFRGFPDCLQNGWICHCDMNGRQMFGRLFPRGVMRRAAGSDSAGTTPATGPPATDHPGQLQ